MRWARLWWRTIEGCAGPGEALEGLVRTFQDAPFLEPKLCKAGFHGSLSGSPGA